MSPTPLTAEDATNVEGDAREASLEPEVPLVGYRGRQEYTNGVSLSLTPEPAHESQATGQLDETREPFVRLHVRQFNVDSMPNEYGVCVTTHSREHMDRWRGRIEEM